MAGDFVSTMKNLFGFDPTSGEGAGGAALAPSAGLSDRRAQISQPAEPVSNAPPTPEAADPSTPSPTGQILARLRNGTRQPAAAEQSPLDGMGSAMSAGLQSYHPGMNAGSALAAGFAGGLESRERRADREALLNRQAQQDYASNLKSLFEMQHTLDKDKAAQEHQASQDAETKRYHDILNDYYHRIGKGGQSDSGDFAAASPASGVDFTKTGDEFLKQIPEADRNKVLAIAEGRAKLPANSMASKNPDVQKLFTYVTAYDPSFDTGNADARVQMRKQFASTKAGDAGGQITAGNTAIGHLGELSDIAEKMGNYKIPAVNAVTNWASKQAGGNTPFVEYNNALGRFVEEATKFYRGVGGNEADIQRAISALDANQSPEQLRAAIRTQAQLMGEKISALQDQWQNVMGEKARLPVPNYDIVHKKAQGALDRIENRYGLKDQPEGAAPKEGAPVAAPGQAQSPSPEPAPSAAVPTSGLKALPTEEMDSARRALARGVPLDLIEKKARENGYSLDGLHDEGKGVDQNGENPSQRP